MRQPRGSLLKFKTAKPENDEGKLQNYTKGKFVRGSLLKKVRSSSKKNPNYPSIYGASS